jgi:hypothetical protein
MNDDLFFLAVCAAAMAGTIAVSATRSPVVPNVVAAPASQQSIAKAAAPEIREIPAITVVGRRSDGAYPADHMARVEHDDR